MGEIHIALGGRRVYPPASGGRMGPKTVRTRLTQYCILSIFTSLLVFTPLEETKAQTRNGSFQMSLGVGAGWNPPVRFDLEWAGEYFINDTFSAGLNVDIFVRGNTAYSFIGFGRYNFYLLDFPRFSPYIGGGVGVLANSAGRGWLDLMAPELGFLWELTPHLHLGPNVAFHLLSGPGNTTWDLQTTGQIAYRF